MNVLYTFLSFICQQIIIQVSYTTLIDRENTKHQPYRETVIKWQLVTLESCSSGWSNLLPRGCHLIIGQYKTMARQILQTNIDLPILPSPPESLHCYGHATTSRLLWIFHSSILFSQSNKLSQPCELTPSYHILATSSRHIFLPFQHSNLPQHVVFFYLDKSSSRYYIDC